MITLRPYQSAAVDKIRTSYRQGRRWPLLVMPTGAGKTVVFSHIAKSVSDREKRALILVHRVELLRQTSAALAKSGVMHGLINPMYTPSPLAPVQVASVQTLVQRLGKIRTDFDLVVIDECFPAGTPIDGTSIEAIRPGQYVWSFNHAYAKKERRRVNALMEREYNGTWYKITTEDGLSVVCTENHPFYTQSAGYVSAKDLLYFENVNLLKSDLSELSKRIQQAKAQKSPLQILQRPMSGAAVQGERHAVDARYIQQQETTFGYAAAGTSVLQCGMPRCCNVKNEFGAYAPDKPSASGCNINPNEVAKPHVSAGCKGEDGAGDARSNVLGSWREWRTDPATDRYSYGDGLPYGIPHPYEGGGGSISKSSEVLQGRPSHSRSEAGYRGRRAITSASQMEVFGQEEDGGFEFVRLASIEICEQGNRSKPEWVPANNLVYNIEVEGNHNYFADGFLVHNCHHATAGSWRKIISALPSARGLGVTATPVRTDGQGLGAKSGGLFDDLIMGPDVADLIKMGFLVRPAVFAPKEKLDLSAIRSRMGDYDKHELEEAIDRPTITGDAVAHYARICPGAPAVAFCVSIKHAEHVATEFRAAGFRAEAVDGSMDDDTRSRILGGLADGSVQIVCSCDLISEGTDIPAIGAAILLRPTKSMGLFVQQVGRALRPYAGKDRAIILDHVGNTLLHGMPDEPREWSLEGERKKRQAGKTQEPRVAVRQCPSCYAVHAVGPRCTECGHVYVVEAREVEVVSGELRQITEADRAALQKKKRQEVGKAQTLEELKAIAAARGYKENWAVHVFNARQNKKQQHNAA